MIIRLTINTLTSSAT